MAAPTASARVAPTGIYLQNGFSTKITFAADTDVDFWEIEVKPAGWDGGEPISTDTMFNAAYNTMAPRVLKKRTPGSAKCAYDPDALADILELVNVRTTVTNTFPDGSTEADYGYLQKFEPDALKEGEMPTANVTWVPTCYDPTNHVEAGPTNVSVAGT